MSNLERVTELMKKVKELERRHNEAKAKLDVAKQELKDKFECDSLAQARAEISKRKKELAKLIRQYEKKLQLFQEKWSEQIGDD